jgi:hypothetical protein
LCYQYGKAITETVLESGKTFKREDMKTAFYVMISDSHYYPEGCHIMVNSFKHFHPDIDLVVFRQDMIDKVFKETGCNWLTAKPVFAKLLYDKYDKVVNIDADTVVTGRLEEVLKDNYDIGAAWNFNDYENAMFDDITEEMYLQAGMVASTKKEFWDTWDKANKDAMKYPRKENDILNLVVYHQLPKLKLKIFDKRRDYYGCKSLGREPEFYIEDDKLMCRKQQVLAYHFARGGVFPKLDFPNMPLKDEVKAWLMKTAYYGVSINVKGYETIFN